MTTHHTQQRQSRLPQKMFFYGTNLPIDRGRPKTTTGWIVPAIHGQSTPSEFHLFTWLRTGLAIRYNQATLHEARAIGDKIELLVTIVAREHYHHGR